MEPNIKYPIFIRNVFLNQNVGRGAEKLSKKEVLDFILFIGMCIDVDHVFTRTEILYKTLSADNIYKVLQREIYAKLHNQAFQKLNFEEQLRRLGLKERVVDMILFWSIAHGSEFQLSAVTLALFYLQTKMNQLLVNGYIPAAPTTRYQDMSGSFLYLVGPSEQIGVGMERRDLAALGVPPPSWFSPSETIVYFHTHEFRARCYRHWLSNIYPGIKFGILAFELPRPISKWVGVRRIQNEEERQLLLQDENPFSRDHALIGNISGLGEIMGFLHGSWHDLLSLRSGWVLDSGKNRNE
ncbi:hypothetical protein EYR41_006090 [Orbilia oligospora]|uniref:Uncharacterized protein n=1 Tax=Orbilia oligospora TaxID=2813651 RepID=A0A8H2E646_ORBOL|nr:hypothetical protein EYR41_006090 [Orbilia oligospora]